MTCQRAEQHARTKHLQEQQDHPELPGERHHQAEEQPANTGHQDRRHESVEHRRTRGGR